MFRKKIDTQGLMTVDEAKKLRDAEPCASCGGHHVRDCPRVKRVVFIGTEIKEVEFWPADMWSAEGIIWPEEIEEVLIDAEEAEE